MRMKCGEGRKRTYFAMVCESDRSAVIDVHNLKTIYIALTASNNSTAKVFNLIGG